MSNSYLLGGRTVTVNTPEGQAALVDAHRTRTRPLCPCSQPAQEMYVALVADHYLVKRMPGTADLHHPDCISFEAPAELSGKGDVLGQAIIEEEDGSTKLKLDFPLSLMAGRKAPPPGQGIEPTSATAPSSRLTLLGLLHHFWHEAGLTKWHPGMTGKRTWFIVRREILRIARENAAKDQPLSERLFIPNQFTVPKKDELAAEWRKFMHQMRIQSGKPQQLGIVIAELTNIERSQYGYKVTMKHMPGMPLHMDEKLAERFFRLSGRKRDLVDMTQNAHLIVIATFGMTPTGFPLIREMTCMAVNEMWLPYDHSRELVLIEALKARSWIKSMRYNLAPDAPIANGQLTDTDGIVALYAPSDAMAEQDFADLERIAGEGAYPAWIWAPEEPDMPALPLAAKNDRGH